MMGFLRKDSHEDEAMRSARYGANFMLVLMYFCGFMILLKIVEVILT